MFLTSLKLLFINIQTQIRFRGGQFTVPIRQNPRFIITGFQDVRIEIHRKAILVAGPIFRNIARGRFHRVMNSAFPGKLDIDRRIRVRFAVVQYAGDFLVILELSLLAGDGLTRILGRSRVNFSKRRLHDRRVQCQMIEISLDNFQNTGV